jgi:hypothetical protein
MDRDALFFGATVAAVVYLAIVIREGHKKNSQSQANLSEQSGRIASELAEIRECLDQIVAITRAGRKSEHEKK